MIMIIKIQICNDKTDFIFFFLVIVSPAKQGGHIGIMTPTAASLSSGASHFLFVIDNSWRDASILFKPYRKINNHKLRSSSIKG